MGYWRVKYIDNYSGGNVSTTIYAGESTREKIIEFFGLKNPDVQWFEVEYVDNEHKGDN